MADWSRASPRYECAYTSSVRRSNEARFKSFVIGCRTTLPQRRSESERSNRRRDLKIDHFIHRTCPPKVNNAIPQRAAAVADSADWRERISRQHYAHRLWEVIGDGPQRGMVTIPVLATYEHHPAQQLRSDCFPHRWASVYELKKCPIHRLTPPTYLRSKPEPGRKLRTSWCLVCG